LKAVRAIAEEARLDLEMPLAWFTAEEAQLLAPVLDRVLLGFYLADSSGIQTHIAERFMEAQEKSGLDVRVLLSANSRFSGPELEAGGLQAFEEGYLEYARGKPLISGIFWSSVESLADADVIK